MRLTLKKIVAAAANSLGLHRRKNIPAWNILTYHRVIDPSTLNYPIQPGMYVHPKSFEMQMDLLQAEANVISLEALISALKAGEDIPQRTVVLTFDDGWRDNYVNAFPLLVKRKLPATIFLATSYLENKNYFWTDVAGLALLQAKTRPGLLQLSDSFEPLGEGVKKELDKLLSRTRRMALPDLLEEFMQYVGKLQPIVRDNLFVALKANLSGELLAGIQNSFLSWNEVKEMGEAGVTFGSHTHTHRAVTELSASLIAYEIETSRKQISSNTPSTSQAFCYPGGDYNLETAKALKQNGVEATLTTDRKSNFEMQPAHLGRISMHEDVTSTKALFRARLWIGPPLN